MSFTYDITTDIGKLRLEIPDTGTPQETINKYTFEDEELQYFLDKANDDIQWAKVWAYENKCSMSASEAGRQINVGDIEVRNNSSLGGSWCALAKQLRELLSSGLAPEGSLVPYVYVGGVYQADREAWEESIADGTLTDRSFWEKFNSAHDSSHVNGDDND